MDNPFPSPLYGLHPLQENLGPTCYDFLKIPTPYKEGGSHYEYYVWSSETVTWWWDRYKQTNIQKQTESKIQVTDDFKQ